MCSEDLKVECEEGVWSLIGDLFIFHNFEAKEGENLESDKYSFAYRMRRTASSTIILTASASANDITKSVSIEAEYLGGAKC